ncbi:expressed unknown protein [Seminavis robusta]|uniref:Uncharacterized protein n=1 Tax=Seminavis robusta TaxID=568900 RepID=A0A9N8EWF6_9STRA|nr:expressed unknown protein [Seminavis robusta]|eukprot:Sro2212_g319250.1 n/a (234) ;mRNA; r:4039-4740
MMRSSFHFVAMLSLLLLASHAVSATGNTNLLKGQRTSKLRNLEEEESVSMEEAPTEDSKDDAKEDVKEDAKGAAAEDPVLELADSETAYKYQLLATVLLTEVDNIANEDVADPLQFYMERIVPSSTEDVVWDIDAGARQFSLNGTDAVGGLWVNFATRRFSFHQLSHFEVYEDSETDGILVAFRYHGVVLEETGNYLDIFGVVREHFNSDDLIDNVFVQRFYTIDRGYTEVEM